MVLRDTRFPHREMEFTRWKIARTDSQPPLRTATL